MLLLVFEGDNCEPNPCGPNSGCRSNNGVPTCFCLPEFEGNPPHQICALPKNPCNPSPCGPNTQCAVLTNGYSKCTCLPGYIESPNTIRGCVEPKNPCDPSPCGIGAVCDASRNPVCSCQEPLTGNPFRECKPPLSDEPLCSPGPCGVNANCLVSSGQEHCVCPVGFNGDPYVVCEAPPRNACEPNPCAPGAECVVLSDGHTLCRCPDGMGGDPTSPTGCHGYECRVDDDCSYDQACIGFRCKDPCPGSCGLGAYCKCEKHHPVCFCNKGLSGNPLVQCSNDEPPRSTSPCVPSPCGHNTKCTVTRNRAVCSCIPAYLGDPKTGCRPECTTNSDCPTQQACINSRCASPCAASICGENAECRVYDHTATCECINGHNGNAYVHCQAISIPKTPQSNPCIPSPCGPNNVCNVFGNVAICDPCFGSEAVNNPLCRPECVSNSDCAFDKACLGSRCRDPCPGSCGHNAVCTVQSHRAECRCPPGLFGNPFASCQTEGRDQPVSCSDVQCGPNTECRKQGNALSCVCLKGFFGNPLIGCAPECTNSAECPSDKICANQKCQNPCPDACGIGAICRTVNHSPMCFCPSGFEGNAQIGCQRIVVSDPPITKNPCYPSPCGPNAECREVNHRAVCSCAIGMLGAPPSCRPECVIHQDCTSNRACLANKCEDPCVGSCGFNAVCTTFNHRPVCDCIEGHVGDPYSSCSRDGKFFNILWYTSSSFQL